MSCARFAIRVVNTRLILAGEFAPTAHATPAATYLAGNAHILQRLCNVEALELMPLDQDPPPNAASIVVGDLSLYFCRWKACWTWKRNANDWPTKEAKLQRQHVANRSHAGQRKIRRARPACRSFSASVTAWRIWKPRWRKSRSGAASLLRVKAQRPSPRFQLANCLRPQQATAGLPLAIRYNKEQKRTQSSRTM